MSDHSRAIVPIETWAFNAPELCARGITVDIGHFAESLIYYDQVILNVANQPQFAQVLSWFACQNHFDTMLSLVAEGTFQVYEYSFVTTPVFDSARSEYILMHLQDKEQQKNDSFESRYLYHKDVEKVVSKTSDRRKLYQTFRGKVIEVKASQFSRTIEESRRDFADARRHALNVQAFIDELYEYRNLGRPPRVEASVNVNTDGSHTVTYNIDFKLLSGLAGPAINWGDHSPLAGSTQSCRFLQSASELECDLYLARPISTLVGDKLYESIRAVNRPGEIIETLKYMVEFPDVRALVNEGRLGVEDILYLRSKAMRFRRWLQDESDRDRDALFAYHHEVAKDAGFRAAGRKMLNMFGFIGAPVVGAILGSEAGQIGAVVGTAIGGGLSWLADIGSKVGEPWRPIVFGNWYRERITELDMGRD